MAQEYKVKRVIFAKFVKEGEVPLDTFKVEEATVSTSELQDGDVLMETLYLSVDPYMRPLMKDMPPGKHYAPSYQPGKPLAGGGVGRVAASKNPNFKEGDIIVGRPVPWATYTIIKKEVLDKSGFRKVPDVDLPLSYYLGALGMPGMTAYAGLKRIAEPKEGEQAFVDSAAGAVGQVVGQLLKHVYNCRVAGSAGTKEKVDLLKELGYDEAFNYKEVDVKEAMQKALPNGIDVHWENVGGQFMDHALELSREHARFVVCGMISDYEKPDDQRYGVKNLFYTVSRRIKIQGMLVGDHADLAQEFVQNMAQYIKEGKVKVVEDVMEGIENMGPAFLRMMKGENLGKQVVMVGKDPHRK